MARRSIAGPTAFSGLLMIAFETIEINEMVAACDGGVALGHPKVYLNLAPSGRVECPYCSRLFINPAVARAGGVAEEAGVIMPSARAAGAERADESPSPRQVGDIAAGGENG
jgi:uncharacterized Zn-finger protein